MLKLALDKLHKRGWREVYLQSSSGNIESSKVIEASGEIFLYEDGRTKYYKIKLANVPHV